MTDYVWNGSEVRMTGRQAKKETNIKAVRSGKSRQSIDILYEIEPADKEDGSWKKWVRKEELFEIVNEPTSEDDRGPTEESISSGEERGDTDWPDSQ